MKNKKAFEVSFGWIFSVIVGAAAIFFAVFLGSQIIKNDQILDDSMAAKQFDILLYPAGTGLESEKVSSPIVFRDTATISFSCSESGYFGEQGIKVSTSQNIKTDSSRGIESVSKDKFIFSRTQLSGKEFVPYVKSFYYPFKVTDFIFLIEKKQNYCFISPPERFRKEIEKLKQDSLILNSSFFIGYKFSDCSRNSIVVCFGQVSSRTQTNEGCDHEVNIESKKVRKGIDTVYYDDSLDETSLLLAAIFSDPDYYECQMKRLMKRTSSLSSIYLEKSMKSECGSILSQQLDSYSNITKTMNSSYDLTYIGIDAESIRRTNERLICPVF
jgi:hypothetical protein